MRKNILNSLFPMLLLVSAGAYASSTLQWKAGSLDILSNPDITLGLAVESEIDSQALFDENNNDMDFTQTWSFNVNTKTTTTEETVNFFDTQLDNVNITIDDVFVAGSELGITTQWAFSSLLATGSRSSLEIAAGSENITGGFSAPKYDVQLGATPIPAIAWLLGSCLFGISGFLLRRKSVSVA